MSTNYYLRRKPTIKDVETVKNLADNTLDGSNFVDIVNYVNDLYSESGDNVIHIGKRSCGWKFLWCTNVSRQNGKIVKMYDFTRESITEFIMRDEYVVVNEYGDLIDKEEFLIMAFEWDIDGYDSVKYNLEYKNNLYYDGTKNQEIFKELGYKFNYAWQSDFYSDGLRFSIFDDFS